MICKNCGMDNIPEDAAFCEFCHQPIETEQAIENADSSSRPEQVYLDLDGSSSENTPPPASGGEDRIDVADPIDFIMSQNSPVEETENKYDANTSDKSSGNTPVQHEKDADPVRFESAIGSSPAAAGIAVKPPKKEEKEPPKPQILTQETPESGSAQVSSDDFRSEEEKDATSKIQTEGHKKEFAPALNIPKPALTPLAEKSQAADLPHVARSRGVILLSGETLTLTGGTRVFPGDEIRIGEKAYEVKPKPRNRTRLIGLIAGGAVVLIVALLFIGGFMPIGNGRLIGVVIGGPNDRPLSGQTVRIDEINKTVTTNQAGFFVFDGLKSGLYTVQYLRDGIPAAVEKIAVVDREATTLALFESRPETSTPTRNTTPAVQRDTRDKNNNPVQRQAEHGTLKLSLNPNDASVFIDDKPLGIGSNDYSIEPGRYVISVKKDGYETRSADITIKSGKTISHDFSLTRVDKEKKKSDGEIAYENEISGKYHEAMRYYDKVLSRSPKDIAATLGKARCCRAQGLNEQAITYYTQAAGIAGSKGDVATQIDALTAIIEIHPNTLTAYSNRGDIYYSEGEYLKAALDYETVVTMDRRNLGALYKLGNSYYYGRDYNRALTAFKAAEELNFADPKAYVFEAKTYLMMGDQRNMRKSYDKCKELSTYAARLEFKKDPDWQKVLDALGVKE